MSDYKLVPVEPTTAMRQIWKRMRGYCWYDKYKAIMADAPDVQGEPVAWVTAGNVDGQIVNGKPRRIWWENNEGVGMPIYAAPRPTEQQPAPDVSGVVEALECALETMENVDGANDCSRGIDAVEEALAAHCKGGDV